MSPSSRSAASSAAIARRSAGWPSSAGRPLPSGELLLAEEDGELRAALPLDGGRPIADPFHRTAELVAMLELRAGPVEATSRSRAQRMRGHRSNAPVDVRLRPRLVPRPGQSPC